MTVTGSDYEGSGSGSEEEVVGADGVKVRRKKKRSRKGNIFWTFVIQPPSVCMDSSIFFDTMRMDRGHRLEFPWSMVRFFSSDELL